MGETAELLAREFDITREEQDDFRAALAPARRRRARKTRRRNLPGVSGHRFEIGNHRRTTVIRENQSPVALAKLKPVFDRKNGTVTAGNSSQITDGAVALLVMTEQRAEELGFTPLGVLAGYAYAGCDPARMGLGPLFAITRAEAQMGLKISDADLIELNEAFAAQVLAVLKGATSEKFARNFLRRVNPLGEIRLEKLNVNGGAIALGHPVGATGARLALTSLEGITTAQIDRRALVTLCVGGGQGAAFGWKGCEL